MKNKVRRYSKIYRKSTKQRSLFALILKYFVIFLLIATGSYFFSMALNSYLKRPHCTKITLTDSDENVAQNSTDEQQSGSVISELYGKQINAVEVDFKVLSGKHGEFDKFLDGLDTEQVNAVVVCLKGPDGKIRYDSQVEQAIEWQTVAKKADVDLTDIIEQIAGRGLLPIARISAFFDQTAPGVDRQNTFIKCESSGKKNVFTFKSRTAVSGAGRWLDVSQSVARKYVVDLVCEAVNFGFKQIVLDYVSFPPVSENERFVYSEEGKLNDRVRSNSILNFVRELEKKGVTPIFSYPVDVVIDDESEKQNKLNSDLGNDIFGDVNRVVGCFKNHAPVFGEHCHEFDLQKYEDFLGRFKKRNFVAPVVSKSVLNKKGSGKKHDKNSGRLFEEIEDNEIFNSKFVLLN